MSSSDKTAVCFATLIALIFIVAIASTTYRDTRPKAVQTCPKCGCVFETIATPDREKETSNAE